MAKKSDHGHLVAILSYLTLIGWIVALGLHFTQGKTRLGSYHLRQTLLLAIVGIILGWIPLVRMFAWIVLLVFWIIGFVYAIQGVEKPIPLIGKPAQEWFKSL
jgi:uncharacterized membrane protein